MHESRRSFQKSHLTKLYITFMRLADAFTQSDLHCISSYTFTLSVLVNYHLAGNHSERVIIQTRLFSASVHTLVYDLQHAKCVCVCVCSCFLEMTRLTACKWSFIFLPNPCVVRILSSSGNSVCRHPYFSTFFPGINRACS